MKSTPTEETETRSELLAGNRGHCADYQRTSDFGRAQEPFTWLSGGGSEEANRSLELLLQDFKRSRRPAQFEVVGFEDEQGRVTFSGEVRVLYVEVDARLSRVRALLQWAPPAPGLRERHPERVLTTRDS